MPKHICLCHDYFFPLSIFRGHPKSADILSLCLQSPRICESSDLISGSAVKCLLIIIADCTLDQIEVIALYEIHLTALNEVICDDRMHGWSISLQQFVWPGSFPSSFCLRSLKCICKLQHGEMLVTVWSYQCWCDVRHTSHGSYDITTFATYSERMTATVS